MHLNKNHNIYIAKDSRSVIKRRGPGISPATTNVAPSYFQRIDRRKIEPKKIPRCLIPSLLVVFPWQLDILVIPLLVTCWALKFKIKAVETPLIVVHNRWIFVYIFCLINICSSIFNEANKIKPLNIERVSQFVSLSFWKCLLVELKTVGKFSDLFFGLFLTNFWTLNSSQACILILENLTCHS